MLLHSGEKECEFSRGLYDGQIFQKLAFFACHDDITDTQRAKMIKVGTVLFQWDKFKLKCDFTLISDFLANCASRQAKEAI